jgi:hypothetical protein
MSKKKRNKTTKRRSKVGVAESCRERSWSDVEEAFFANAPPDQAEPPAAPESFDDLLPIASPGEGATWAMWDRWSGRVPPRVAAIALASMLILLGLTAVVFASLG